MPYAVLSRHEPSNRFVVNGGAFPTSTILTSTGNLSVIDTIPAAVPNMYEVQTTYQIRQNGGSLITYLQASPDARFGVSGTYYAVELTNIVAGAGTCTATLAAWKSGEGAPRSANTIGCRDGMTLRMLFRENSIFVTQDGIGVLWLDDAAPIVSGRAGVGAMAAPAVNGITRAAFYNRETTPPGMPAVPGVAAFADRVEMQWPGVSDGTGSGLYLYDLYRMNPDGQWVHRGHYREPSFTDYAVTASTQYVYRIHAVDMHMNWSAPRDIVVNTAPPGTWDPRQTGLRPDGAYWGGGGEQINACRAGT